jgi:hypothetical protein
MTFLLTLGCGASSTVLDGLDGGGKGVCPAAQPAAGATCGREGLECMYGDDPRVQCRSRVVCTAGAWSARPPQSGCDPLPDVTCPPSRDAADGASCTPQGAYCSYDGLACLCTTCPDPYPICQDLPEPVWACDAPNPDPECPAAIPNLGTSCAPEAKTCTYGCEAGMARTCRGGVWIEDSSPGGCPISTRRAKRDIEYLSREEIDGLAREVARLPVATFEYRDPALRGRRRLGFILEDAPSSFAVDPERSQVDLYGYATLLLATTQSQARRIESLEREVRELNRRACVSGEPPRSGEALPPSSRSQRGSTPSPGGTR